MGNYSIGRNHVQVENPLTNRNILIAFGRAPLNSGIVVSVHADIHLRFFYEFDKMDVTIQKFPE
jgi:hypothetical protein